MSPLHTVVPSVQHTRFVLLPSIVVQIPLLYLPLYIRVVAELAFVTFITSPSLIKHAKDGLRIHTKRYLLHLHGFQKRNFLFSTLLLFSLLFLSKDLFSLLLDSRARFTG